MSSVDLMNAIIFAGMALSGAYFWAGYRLWRRGKAAELRRQMGLRIP